MLVMKHVYFVTVLVVRPHGDGYQLLLARRAEDRYMGGTWHVISGGIEPDETAWQAVLREMREETRLAPVELYCLSTISSFYRPDNDSLNIAPMFCAVVDKEAAVTLNPEHTAFEWIDVNEADSRLMWPADRQALEEIRTTILTNSVVKECRKIPRESWQV